MDRFSFEVLGDRVLPAGLVMPPPVVFPSAVVSRLPASNPVSTPVKPFGLASQASPPLPGIEGTDVGGDTFYSYHG